MVSVESFSIGKHLGRSFEDVVSDDPDYCRWAFRLEDPKGDIAEFATYLRQHHGGILTFGKHSGKLFSEIVAEDPDYCGWALTIPDPSPMLAEFVEFLNQNMGTRARGRQSKKQVNQAHGGNRTFEHMFEAVNQSLKMQQPASSTWQSWQPDASSQQQAASMTQKSHKMDDLQMSACPSKLQKKKGRCKQDLQMTPESSLKSKKHKVKPTKAETTTKKESMSAAQVTATPVKKKILKKRASSKAPQENECTICMDSAVETVFVPCGHMVACSACGEQFKKKACPICRKKVKQVVRAFKA